MRRALIGISIVAAAICVAVAVDACTNAHAGVGSMGVGHMMSPGAQGTGGPPADTFHIQTEAGDNLTTEASDSLVTEDSP